MATHYRTQGFILKKTDRGEADQILTIYTKDFGKLEILGKAIRKIKSKLRPSADIFCLSEIEFIQGKTYKTLTDAILIKRFSNFLADLTKWEIANRIAEDLDNFIKGPEKEEQVWLLLNEVFEKLNHPKVRDFSIFLIYYYFLWNFLSLQGYQIDLYNCAICQKKLVPHKLYFSLQEGGIICSECSKKTKSKKEEISPEIIKILRLFLKRDWDILSKLKITEEYKNSLDSVSQKFLSFCQEATFLEK